MFASVEMDSEYRSVVSVRPDAWLEHFKQSVGKPYLWGQDPSLVVMKNKAGTRPAEVKKEMPLNVVSPIEQYGEMAKAELDKNSPKYRVPSVASKLSGRTDRRKGRSRRRRRRNERSVSKKKRNKGSERKTGVTKGRKRKTGKDIFS